jgi:hypothetical protein
LGKCRLRHKAANAALDTLDVIGSRRELGDGLLNPPNSHHSSETSESWSLGVE